MNSRAATAISAPLTAAPVAGTRPGALPGNARAALESALDKTTAAGEWYVFDSATTFGPRMFGISLPGSEQVYCRMGGIGGDPLIFINTSVGKSYECVTLKKPVPAVATGLLKAQVDQVGSATFDPLTGLDAKKATMTFRRSPPWSSQLSLSNGRPMAGFGPSAAGSCPSTPPPRIPPRPRPEPPATPSRRSA
ncbi:MAG: hypothetical protein M0D55_06435 [Elusimicrobiota bacterium]|nr:MAG: hypothetical protein M0D55_06435 [Elusimicrobiota bacterium]